MMDSPLVAESMMMKEPQEQSPKKAEEPGTIKDQDMAEMNTKCDNTEMHKAAECLPEENEESVGIKCESGSYDEVDGSPLTLPVITNKMVEEEENLKEDAEAKERIIQNEQDKLWNEMDEGDREQRYTRLKFLLNKSNMYTQYLLERMVRQKEIEKKSKRKTKKEEKENVGQSEKKEDTRVERRGRKRKLETAEVPLSSEGNTKKPKLVNGKSKEEEDNMTDENTNSQESDESPEVHEDKKDDNDVQKFGSKPVLFVGGELRPYQQEGFLWLKTLYENGVNGILADEMGLGKTVQCIAQIAHLVHMGVPGPYIVVAPLSTLPNWNSEFKRFAPKVPVVLYHGSKDERSTLRKKIRLFHRVENNIKTMPVVITSYEMSMIDRKFLMNHDWKYLIVDEGQRIKNTHCRLIRELRLYKNTHRLLLTGTPLQNNLAELWSLLNFLLPEIFDDLGSFEAWFDVERISSTGADEAIVREEQRNNILSMLHQILTPFMLRRLKCDVDLLIPPKKEIIVYAPLTPIQKEFYSSTVNKTIFTVIEERREGKKTVELNSKGRPVRSASKNKVDYSLFIESAVDSAGPKKLSSAKKKDEEEIESWMQSIVDLTTPVASNKTTQRTSQVTIRLQNVMMQLRKCCNHPYLLEYPFDKDGQFKIDKELIRTSGKMLLLDRMLTELKAKGHKVLLFSQMTKMLDVLQDYCFYKKYDFCRLDGSYSFQERQENMDAFNNDPDMFLFLLSTRAGGLGINLTAADTVIIYDSDWNPQCDLQAQDRCHRIGQTKPVVIYRYVTANTIDQRIVERAAAKRKLEKMVILKGKFKSGIKDFDTSIKPLSPQELLELLKSQDHQQEMKTADDKVISDKDLASVLDRSDLYQQWDVMKGEKGKTDTKTKRRKNKDTAKKEVTGVFQVISEEHTDLS